MLLIGIAMSVLGYALAYTGTTAAASNGTAPGLLYNLGISDDPTAGQIHFGSQPTPGGGGGSSWGNYIGGAIGGIGPISNTTPVGPAMPAPTAGGQPHLVLV